MVINPGFRSTFRCAGRLRQAVVMGTVVLCGSGAIPGLGDDAARPLALQYYSTAGVPRDYPGPLPRLLLAWNSPAAPRDEARPLIDRALAPTRALEPEQPPAASPATDEAPRVASRAAAPTPPAPPSGTPSQADLIALANRTIADCQVRYRQIHDYTCTFHKRERIDGHLGSPHIMNMKVRSQPTSVYFKFQRPNKGREAIYVAGKNNGKVIAHDVGLGKLVAGTMRLDPKGEMAMEDNRHPITEAGIGALTDTVARHWAAELTPEESRITFHNKVMVANHACTMIESVHPQRRPNFMFHIVKLYIDHEHGLPIRMEAYDWPKHPGTAPELIEEYTYLGLRTNVGLRDHDFDPTNSQYSYGRF